MSQIPSSRHRRVPALLAAADPVISVDTKKKELVGEYAKAGREWQPSGQPAQVLAHDFPHPEVPRAIPYGVYDVGADDGFVSVGIDHDTAAFAVNAIRQVLAEGDLPKIGFQIGCARSRTARLSVVRERR